MKHYYFIIYFTLILLIPGRAQETPTLTLSDHMQIIVNDSSRNIKPNLIDSIKNHFTMSDIRFSIVRSESKNGKNITTIRIPQTHELNQVLIQLIIYYGLCPTEAEKAKEEVRVYPYFYSIHDKPFIISHYKKNGRLTVRLYSWETTPVPPEPLPEEKQIFNDLMNYHISSISSLDDIDEKMIELFARSKSMPTTYVKSIYQNILLWQLSQ